MTANYRERLQGFRLAVAAGVFMLAGALTTNAWALSELQREDLPVPTEDGTADDTIQREQLPPPESSQQDSDEAAPTERPDMSVPLPDPIVRPQTPDATGDPAQTDEQTPPILYDVELLPEPVRRMRDRILEASLTGDLEQLRPLFEVGDNSTQLSFGETPGDPVEFLRELSGDDEGQEILAILYEVLSAGYVRLDEGEPTELYVWPYFFAVPLETLDKRQRVELFKLVTAGDYEDMKNFGAYIFYRVGISPEGRWLFFVAGD